MAGDAAVCVLWWGGFVGGWFFVHASCWLCAALVFGGFLAAWLWWAYSVPQWRQWALERGADQEELQALAVAAKLVWPKVSFCEKTEFRNGRR